MCFGLKPSCASGALPFKYLGAIVDTMFLLYAPRPSCVFMTARMLVVLCPVVVVSRTCLQVAEPCCPTFVSL